MKNCNYIGYRLHLGIKVPHSRVIDAILALDGTTAKRGGKDRFFHVAQKGAFIIGRWCGLDGRKREPVTEVATKGMIFHKLPDGYEFSAPNYFVLHTTTFAGLYQSYKSSNSYQHFFDLMISLASKARKVEYQAAMAGVGKKATSDRNKVHEDYGVACHALLRQEKLEEILNKWESLSSFTFQVASVKPSAEEYGPLADHTRLVVQELRLKTSTEVVEGEDGESLSTKVAKTFTMLMDRFKSALKRTTVTGTNQFGKGQTEVLGRYVDRFGQDSLNEVLTDKELESADMLESVLLERMISLCNDRPEYFHKVAK